MKIDGSGTLFGRGGGGGGSGGGVSAGVPRCRLIIMGRLC